MAPSKAKNRAAPPDYKTIAAQFAAAQCETPSLDLQQQQREQGSMLEKQRTALEAKRKQAFERRWLWAVAFWLWLLAVHVTGIGYFTSGFLLTRMELEEKAECDVPPPLDGGVLEPWPGKGTIDGGCWHPKTFDGAVVLVIDALRYDFTVPVHDGAPFHDAFPFLHDTAVRSPAHAFLRPFIADPPTTTLQRLKGLTTGTLPTFMDAGRNFAGTAIEEDNLLMQLRQGGKRIVHLGDDTWQALYPGYFEANTSRAYESFNVWDLHTVDEGVMDHMLPLLDRRNEWDLLIGHCLGVDHAGHRFGPAHVEMTHKLAQMNKFVEEVAAKMDDRTLLVVMGDHGMDAKGDHGGESDDEVEAALWMYSRRPVFGRTVPEFAEPPSTAKIRPVNQIDLVPTLALLLGIAIPYNSLGRPIEEAFAGAGKKTDWDKLAAVERVTAASIRRYLSSYFSKRGVQQSSGLGSPADLWAKAESLVQQKKGGPTDWAAVHAAFARYQEATLGICKDLWARFDVANMILGLVVMVCGLVALLVYASRDVEEGVENVELDVAEMRLEMLGLVAPEDVHKTLVLRGLLGAAIGLAAGLVRAWFTGPDALLQSGAPAAVASTLGVLYGLQSTGKSVSNLVPTSGWSWMAVVFTLGLSLGFASNSYTVWEDAITLFFLTTFGVTAALYSFRLTDLRDRYMAIYHSVLFVVLGYIASYSKLCREEQMPYCRSTYYASETTSTSAAWQLLIPYVASLVLPSIIKAYMVPSKSYEGIAPICVGYMLRAVLFLSAVYWTLDAADNGKWFPGLPETLLKTASVYDAQMVLALAVVAGVTAFAWAPPCVRILTRASKTTGLAQVTVLGYANAHGARYLLLPLDVLGAVFLLSKPMGGGSLALMMWQTLSLAELLDLLSLTAEPVGPVVLALLGNFHFFGTGHQAVLSTIQWESAFVPLFAVRYPWSPLAVALNTFAGPVLAAAAAPLLVLWKVGPRRRHLLADVSRALAAFVAFYAVESTATMAWAGWLRRHLMLFRVFNPRFMTAAAFLLVVDVLVMAVALVGVRVNILAVGDVFGWAD